MVVSPATVGLFGHNQALVFVGTHRVLAHGITEHLGLLSDVRIGQIVVAVVFEGKRTFRLTVGQVFQTVDTVHFKLTVAELDLLLRCIIG